ncbi:MAG: PAS domain S-box protein [Pleurocapsa minor GSE-CHR-MK-17-07R]|jgi:PAS domain S-box-containing protein|nr:PAS domain S-box protein [Pleurocapsa minor GSE-CHR-MK 17-07R]
MPKLLSRFDIRITLLYFLAASAWIIASDTMLNSLLTNSALGADVLNMLKGLGFVAVTTTLLYILLRRERRLRLDQQVALDAENEKSRSYYSEMEMSEQRFRKAVEEAPLPVIIFAEDGEILSISRAWLEITGYTRQQLKTIDDWTAFAYSDQKQAVKAIIDGLFTLTGRIDEGEFTIRCADGSKRIWSFSSTPLGRSADGRRVAISMAADMTDFQRNAQQLRENEEMLRLFIEHAPAALAMLDNDMRYLAVSRRCMTDYRLGSRNIVGLSHYDVFPEIPDHWRAIHKKALEGESQKADDELFTRSDGTLQRLHWEVHPWHTGEGAIGGIIIFTEDITERANAQAALRESEAQIRYQANLIESVSDAVISTDSEFRIRSWNKAAQHLYGWTADEVIGKPLNQIVITSYPNGDGDDALASFRRDGLWRGEVIQHHRDGTPIDIMSSVSLTFDSAGNPTGAVGINRDIRERKRAEQNLKSLNQRLTILRRIDGEIIKASTPEMITRTVLQHIRELIPCEVATMTLVDKQEQLATIFMLDVSDTMPSHPHLQRPHIRDHMTEMLEKGLVVRIPDLAVFEDKRSAFMQRAIDEGIRASLTAPLLIHNRLFGHISLASKTPGFFSDEHSEILSEVADQLAVAFHNAEMLETIRSNHQQLSVMSTRLVEAQEAERAHIARELHDEVGQSLTALSLLLEMQQRQSDADNPTNLNEAKSLVSDLTRRIRDISLDLRPSMLDDLGLIPALAWYLQRYQQQTRITVDFKHSDVKQRFAPLIETTLYRTVQEALTNVARYARSDHATVRLWATAVAIHAQIEDTGVGFDAQAEGPMANTGGLVGLRERAQLANGVCEIISNPGEGTLVSVTIPFVPIH